MTKLDCWFESTYYHDLDPLFQTKWAIEVYPAAAEAFALNHSAAKVINLDCNEVLKIAMDGKDDVIRWDFPLIKNFANNVILTCFSFLPHWLRKLEGTL